MSIARFTKSELFTAYNKARAAARRSGDTKRIERLNRALGILQSKAYYTGGDRDLYRPTVSDCGCKDWQYHTAARRQYCGPCKHMLAEILTGEILANQAAHNVTSWLTVKTESEVNA